jgi:hypothetical protein
MIHTAGPLNSSSSWGFCVRLKSPNVSPELGLRLSSSPRLQIIMTNGYSTSKRKYICIQTGTHCLGIAIWYATFQMHDTINDSTFIVMQWLPLIADTHGQRLPCVHSEPLQNNHHVTFSIHQYYIAY